MQEASNFLKGTKYLNSGRIDKAIVFFKRQLKEFPFKEAYLNLGNAYRLKDMDDLALECYSKSADPLTPFASGKFGHYEFALTNLGLLEYTYGNDDRAIELYTAALSVNPTHYDAIWNYSSALLRKGCSREEIDWNSAWKMYEFRFNRSNPTPVDKTIPRWNGYSTGRRIVVLAEQGIGDKIMFGRYLHCLKDYFEEIWIQVPVELEPLFSEYKTCQDIEAFQGDVSIPICSLAARFGFVEPEWLKGKFDCESKPGFNVGVVWSGSTTHANNRNRSIDPRDLLHLTKYCNLYSLNPGVTTPRGIEPFSGKDWGDTARLVQSLDLVISVDTSIVHLAGSMGVECWMMQPIKETDFRWGNDSMGSDNIWYPSVKVIRNPQDWKIVLNTLEEMLKNRANNIKT